MTIPEIRKAIARLSRKQNAQRKTGYLDATYYARQAEIDQLNRDLFAAQKAVR